MAELTRRDLLGAAVLAGGWSLIAGESASAQQPPTDAPPAVAGPYALPPLPYGYADLEPYIDAQTVKLHHDIHHAGYVRGANAATVELERVRRVGGQEIARVRTLTDKLTYNLSGHLLHSVYWTNMTREGGGDPPPDTDAGRAIRRDFGSVAAFRAQFQAAAQQVQGCGWAVLAYEPNAQRLVVLQAEKHQNLSVWGATPLLVLDVWEHAYYLKYQNKRSSYIKAFMNVVNWSDVDRRLRAAK